MLRLMALVMLLALVGGAVYLWKANPHAPPRNLSDVKDQIKDSVLSGEVKTAFSLHRRLKPYAVSVSTENGVVTLRGQLPQEELRGAAERLAASVPEVRQVVNQITLGGVAAPAKGDSDERSLGERLDDEGLEVQVKMAFSLNKNMRDSKIEVAAWKKEVRLTGEVASADLRKLALETVREIAGVKSVTDTLSVRGDAAPSSAPTEERRAAVMRALHANPNLSEREIAVRFDGDRMVLVGHVKSGAERDLAGLLARDASGRTVQNDLEIRP